MNTVLSYCYAIFIIISFSAVLSSAISLNHVSKTNLFKPVIGLYSFYLIDTIIINLTEEFPFFLNWYNITLMNSPSIKTVIYMGIGFFTLYAWNVATGSGFSFLQVGLLGILGTALIFIPIFPYSPFKVWLYFLVYQIFNVGLCIYGLWKIKRMSPEALALPYTTLKWIMLITIIISVVMVGEDSYVIYILDDYTIGRLSVQNRSFTEDILRIIYAVFYFCLLLKSPYKANDSAVDDIRTEESMPVEGDAKALLSQETSPEDGHILSGFAQYLNLTEREQELLGLLLDGLSNQQISDTLHISMSTVKTHMHNIFQKAGVTHRYEILRMYEHFTGKSR